MPWTYYTKQNDLEPPITGQLLNQDGTLINLTFALNVYFVMRPVGLLTGTIRRLATIVNPYPDIIADPDAIQVQYSLVVGDTATVQNYSQEWEIQYPGSPVRPMSVPNLPSNNNLIVVGDDLD